MIDCIGFYFVSAIFQPYNGGFNSFKQGSYYKKNEMGCRNKTDVENDC